MPHSSQQKRGIEHIRHGCAHMTNEQRQSGEHERRHGQNAMQRQIAQLVEG